MQTTGLATMRRALFACIVASAIVAAPGCAADNTDAGDVPLSVTAKVDNASESINDAAQAPNPSMAMASSSASTDSLASFGPSSGTVVGNRALELRDEILRLR